MSLALFMLFLVCRLGLAASEHHGDEGRDGGAKIFQSVYRKQGTFDAVTTALTTTASHAK